jgi:hypothetical protein
LRIHRDDVLAPNKDDGHSSTGYAQKHDEHSLRQ